MCQIFGYFGDESAGPIWKEVKESGTALIDNLPDPKDSGVSSYLYALECAVSGGQVGRSVNLQIVDTL